MFQPKHLITTESIMLAPTPPPPHIKGTTNCIKCNWSHNYVFKTMNLSDCNKMLVIFSINKYKVVML